MEDTLLAEIEQADAVMMFYSCPYTRSHFSPGPKLEWHIQRSHPNKENELRGYKTCRSNNTHLVEAPMMDEHYKHCKDGSHVLLVHTMLRGDDSQLMNLIDTGAGTYPRCKNIVTYGDQKCSQCHMLNPQILFNDTTKLLKEFSSSTSEPVVVLKKTDPEYTPGASRRNKRRDRHHPHARDEGRERRRDGQRDDRRNDQTREERSDERRDDRSSERRDPQRNDRRDEQADDQWGGRRGNTRDQRTNGQRGTSRDGNRVEEDRQATQTETVHSQPTNRGESVSRKVMEGKSNRIVVVADLDDAW